MVGNVGQLRFPSLGALLQKASLDVLPGINKLAREHRGFNHVASSLFGLKKPLDGLMAPCIIKDLLQPGWFQD